MTKTGDAFCGDGEGRGERLVAYLYGDLDTGERDRIGGRNLAVAHEFRTQSFLERGEVGLPRTRGRRGRRGRRGGDRHRGHDRGRCRGPPRAHLQPVRTVPDVQVRQPRSDAHTEERRGRLGADRDIREHRQPASRRLDSGPRAPGADRLGRRPTRQLCPHTAERGQFVPASRTPREVRLNHGTFARAKVVVQIRDEPLAPPLTVAAERIASHRHLAFTSERCRPRRVSPARVAEP
jgi:hypothetical protein